MSLIGRLVQRRSFEVITVKRQTGHTSSGDATFGAAFTMAARIERTASESPDLDGRRINGGTKLFTIGELQHGDLVWLPEANVADDAEAFRPATIDAARALDGSVTHWVTVLS